MQLLTCLPCASTLVSCRKILLRPAGSRAFGFCALSSRSLSTTRLRRTRPFAVEEASADTPAMPAAASPATPAPVYVEVDKEFNIAKVSFGKVLTPVGSALLVYGFASYIQLVPGGDLSSLLLIYGFVGGLLGFALLYAQLNPVPLKTTAEAYALRSSQMTDIQKQVREDCTRFRYGDEQHLEEALDRVFRFNKPMGIARRLAPVLTGLREETRDGMYALILEFRNRLPVEQWDKRLPKIQSFFGPGIIAQLDPKQGSADSEQPPEAVDLLLICDGSGKGRGGGEKPDVLPPLMPGLKARQQ